LHLKTAGGEVAGGQPGKARGHAQTPRPAFARRRRRGEHQRRRGDAKVEKLVHLGLVLEQGLLAHDRQVEAPALAPRQQIAAGSPDPGDVPVLHDPRLALETVHGGDRKPCGGEEAEDCVELRLRLETDAQRHAIPRARLMSRHGPSVRAPSPSSRT